MHAEGAVIWCKCASASMNDAAPPKKACKARRQARMALARYLLENEFAAEAFGGAAHRYRNPIRANWSRSILSIACCAGAANDYDGPRSCRLQADLNGLGADQQSVRRVVAATAAQQQNWADARRVERTQPAA